VPEFSEHPPIALSIVIPVLDEEGNLRELHSELMSVLGALGIRYEVIFVDDGSTDGSTEILESLAGGNPRLKVIIFRKHYGKVPALRAGIEMAIGEYIMVMDADRQNDPKDIPLYLEKLKEGYDVVHGWRKNRRDPFLFRKIPSKVANWIIAKSTGFPSHDLGCAFIAMRAEVFRGLQLVDGLQRFLPVLAHWQGAKCAEVVVNHRPRVSGKSKFGISRTLPVILDLLTIKILNKYLLNPMKLVGSLGAICILLGFLTSATAVSMRIWLDIHITRNPLLLTSFFLIIIGIQFLMMGILGEISARTYLSAHASTRPLIRRCINVEAK
jgi:glycosyltransferase involved in cell wall biosynthesis